MSLISVIFGKHAEALAPLVEDIRGHTVAYWENNYSPWNSSRELKTENSPFFHRRISSRRKCSLLKHSSVGYCKIIHQIEGPLLADSHTHPHTLVALKFCIIILRIKITSWRLSAAVHFRRNLVITIWIQQQ